MHDSDKQPITEDSTRIRRVAGIARALTIVVAAALAVGLAQAPRAGAHDDGSTTHLWLDHIKSMKAPGTVNDATNPVDWTQLKGVPAGIADGTDNGVEYAGSGLRKAFGTIFFVDVGEAQRRVKTTCPKGQAMRSIDKHGAAVCTKGPVGLSKTIADAGPMCDSECTVATLVLTPGTWSITAKLTATQDDVSVDDLQVDCHLDAAGGSSAKGSHRLHGVWGIVTLRIQLLATVSGNLHASLVCGDGDVGQIISTNVSIMAIRVAQ